MRCRIETQWLQQSKEWKELTAKKLQLLHMMYSSHILHLTQMASLCYWSKGSSCTMHFHIYKTTQNWHKHRAKQPKIDINAWNAVLAGSSDFLSCLMVKWDFSVQQNQALPKPWNQTQNLSSGICTNFSPQRNLHPLGSLQPAMVGS
jgi:hypothetical protein